MFLSIVIGVIDPIDLLVIDVDIRDEDRLDAAVGGHGGDQRLDVREQRLERLGVENLFRFFGIEREDADDHDVDAELLRMILVEHAQIELAAGDVPVLGVLDVVAVLIAEGDLGAVLELADELDPVDLVSLQIYIEHKIYLLMNEILSIIFEGSFYVSFFGFISVEVFWLEAFIDVIAHPILIGFSGVGRFDERLVTFCLQ